MTSSVMTTSRIRTATRLARDGRGWPTCCKCGGRLFPAAGAPVCVACPIPFRLPDRSPAKTRTRRGEGGGR